MRDQAIYSTHPNVVCIKSGIDAFDKSGTTVVLDESKIATEVNRLNAEFTANEYARKRQVEYPSIENQLDYIFHNGIEKWKTDIVQPIKNKYPKPE